MNKQILKEGIEYIKKVHEADKIITTSLRFLNEDFNYFTFGWIESRYLKLLKDVMKDDSDWISYYIYDCKFGKKPMEVIYKSGKKIKLKTINQLYDLIITK